MLSMGRKSNQSKSVIKNNIATLAIKISAIVFCLVCLATIISTQATIVEKQNELSDLQSREEALTEENGEYERILNEDDTNSYMLGLAVGSMGYSYPDEIRFYDTSRN
jgi:cell division protein FtsL